MSELSRQLWDGLARSRVMCAVRGRLELLPVDHPLVRRARAFRHLRGVRGIADRLLGGARLQPAIPLDTPLFTELLRRADAAAPRLDAVPRRVLLVNTGLAAGGAERQVVNTLLGLGKERLESISFLGEHLFEGSDRGFLIPLLADSGIPLTQVTRYGRRDYKRIAQSVRKILDHLPLNLAERIVDLVAEFRERRPEVVHAWQDDTSIKCGLAAVIAGVPRIVLSSRNVNPSNFAYFQPYMHPAYRALARRPEVIFCNNSEAGAADYCRWLDLPSERYQVVRNGVALDGLRRDVGAGRALRAREEIPPDAPVVGSIFRFWPEKRPLLWVETALWLLGACPDAHFLIAGDGPLRNEMTELIRASQYRDRFHLVAPTHDVGAVLSALDVFLLTSRFEGTPNVLLEAQWIGLPVVALDAGGVAEAVGRSGIVCAEETPQIIASHLLRILDDREWRERAPDEGASFVRDRFAPERMIAETMALYGYGEGS